METPILETERLLLRPLTTADADAVFRNWSSDREATKYMRWELHQTVEDARAWLVREERNVMSDTVYNWGYVLKAAGELIGCGGLLYTDKYDMMELGYILARRYWKQGLATEAARAIVGFANHTLRLPQLFCCHAVENTASGNVIRKLGFVYQNDGVYARFDRKRMFPCKEYLLRFADTGPR